MNKIDKLIRDVCPNGVEYKTIGEIWNRAPKSKLGVNKVKMLKPGENICFTSGQNTFMVEDYLVDGEYLFLNDGGTADVKYHFGRAHYTDHVIAFSINKNVNLKTKFLYYYLKNVEEIISSEYFKGVGIKNLVVRNFLNFKIPIPPIEIQNEIVNILDKFVKLEAELEAELEARVKQYEFWRGKLLNKKGTSKLSDIAVIKRGKRVVKSQLSKTCGYPVYQNNMTPLGFYDKANCQGNTTFIIAAGSAGSIGYSSEDFWAADDCYYVECSNKVISKYMYYTLLNQKNYILSIVRRASIPRISRHSIENIKLSILPLEEQERIVKILDKFDILINDIKEGLPAEIELRRKQYEYYRSELLTFEELKTN